MYLKSQVSCKFPSNRLRKIFNIVLLFPVNYVDVSTILQFFCIYALIQVCVCTDSNETWMKNKIRYMYVNERNKNSSFNLDKETLTPLKTNW